MSVSVLLAVDDRPDNLFVLEQVVGAYLPEIKMLTAQSAEAGLALAATEAVDGALIDVQMPGLNGIEMCRRLKADPRTALIHVILVTAHGATSALKAQGLEAGADDFITKPIDNVELAAKLRVMLRLRAAEDALRRERDHLDEAVRERTQALRDAEYRYRTLFQTAGDAIFINDLEGQVLEVNEEACRLLGYTRDELLHLTVNDLVSPHYVPRRPELLQQLCSQEHLVFENELVTRDGRIIPAECSSRLMDLQGRTVALSICRDITERKAAEAALQKSEQRVREKLESILSPEGDIGDLELADIIDVPGIQALMDDFYELTHFPMSILDLQGKVLVGVGWQEVCTKFHRVHPETARNCLESDLQLSRGISPGKFKLYRCKNHMWDVASPLLVGGQHLGNVFAGQFFFEGETLDYGRFRAQARHHGFDEALYIAALERVPRLSRTTLEAGIAFLLKLTNMLSLLSYSNIKLACAITERAALTTSLQTSESRLRTLYETVQAGIILRRADGTTLQANRVACDLFGIKPEEITAMTWSDQAWQMVREDGAPIPWEEHPSMLTIRTGQPIRNAVRGIFTTDPQDVRWLLINTEPISDPQTGKLQEVTITFQDITDIKRAEEALQASEKKFRLVFEKAPIGIMHYDQTSTVTDCNEKFAVIIGAPKEQFIGFNMIRQLQDDQMRQAVAASLQGRTGYYEGDYLSVTAGKLTAIMAIFQPILTPDGAVSGGITIFEDITERKRAESELKLKERLLDSASDSIFLHDLEGNFLYMNEAAYITRWYTKDELLRLGAWALATPEAAVYQDNIRKELWANGELIFESEHRRKDGSVIPVEIFARVLAVEDREMILSIARDITERERAEEELRKSEKRYRAMITNIINAVALHEMLYDSQGRPSDYRFLMFNPAFEKLTGFSAQQVVGKTVLQVFPGVEPFWIETYGRVVATGAPVSFERYDENLKRYFQVTAYKTQDNQFATIFSDITATKQAEADRLAAMTDSLQSLATAIEMRDPYTSGHQRSVSALAGAIAREMGLDAERIKGIELGGILHDVGKISVPAEILSKPGKLSETEFAIIQIHPESGYEILKNIAGPWPLAQMILQHHERLDGSGYPHGLKNDEIILEAKILAVADVVEAMAAHRPYRPALGLDRALEEITRNRGILYEPEAVDACIKLFTEKGFHLD